MTDKQIDLTEQLRLWGAAHSKARAAERAVTEQHGGQAEGLREDAQRLRERADRLHHDIYGEIGRRGRKE